MKVLRDILMTSDPEKSGEKYSQSRVYLLFSFVTLLCFLYGDMFWEIGGDNFEYIVDTTFYTMGFFGSYAMFKKGMSHAKAWKEISAQREEARKNDS